MFRQHALPVHCSRCYTVFKCDTELVTHQRLPEGCEVRTVELPEGYNREQEGILRRKRKLAGSEEEKWRAMYKILFPDDDESDIPTPCRHTSIPP